MSIEDTAPNGQFRDRIGSCDRKEKGRKDGPFDNIAATANTRAEDRAIMALVGGENTSEEFEEDGVEGKEAEKAPPSTPLAPPKTEKERLREIDKKLDAIVAAIEQGVLTETTRDRLLELEGQKKMLEETLCKPAPAPYPSLHPNLAGLYKRKVAALKEALNDPEIRSEAGETAGHDGRDRATQAVRQGRRLRYVTTMTTNAI